MILIEIDIRHIFEIVETRIMIKIAEKQIREAENNKKNKHQTTTLSCHKV